MPRLSSLLSNLIVLIGLFSVSVHSEFPTDPKPCAYGDSECLVKIMNHYAEEKFKGDGSIDVPSFDPLKISEMRIKQGADSPVNVDIVFSNIDLVGLHSVTVYKVKGFGKDLTGKHEIHFKLKSASIVGDYKITGRVLLLPISGSGKSNMTMADTDIGLYFSGIPVEKNGETYMKLKDMRITFKPKRVYYHFDNLFNGEKELSDNMNLFLNENWQDIFNEVKGSLSTAFGKVFENVINGVFNKYPYNKYFAE